MHRSGVRIACHARAFSRIIWGGLVGKGDPCSKPANYSLPFNLSFWVDLKLLSFVACLQQLCGHLLKFKMYFGSLFPSHGRCGTSVVSGSLPRTISQIALFAQELFHLQIALTIAHLATLTSWRLKSLFLMQAKEFILKYK